MTNYKILSPVEEELITQFTDMILTVSLKDCDVADIVREVNTHHCTRACRKYSDYWRFHLPNKVKYQDPKVRKAVAEHTKSVLSKVKSVLKNNDLMSGSVTPIHVFTSCFMHFISRQNFIHLELSIKTRHYFWLWREK